MSVKKYMSVLALCVVAMPLCAQQAPQFSHYMFNTPMFNPASAGFTNSIVANGVHRQQWYGFDGAPQQTHVSLDAPIRAIQSGVGLNFINDRIGQYDHTFIQMAYNYQIPFLDGALGMGIQFGMNSLGLKLTNVLTQPGEEGDIAIQDRADASDFKFDIGMGFFYKVQDQYEVGISIDRLNNPHSKDLSLTQDRTLNLFGNYSFTLDRFPKIDFVPSTLLKFNIFKSKAESRVTNSGAQSAGLSAFQMDLSLIGFYDKQYWGGLTYRLGDAIVLLGGLDLSRFQLPLQVGVAYDITTNRISGGTKIGGGFEVFVRYSFNLSVDRVPQSWKNSRFL